MDDMHMPHGKIGPLPTWGWGLILGGAAVGILYMHHTSTAAANAATTPALDSGSTDAGAGINGGTGVLPQDTPGTLPMGAESTAFDTYAQGFSAFAQSTGDTLTQLEADAKAQNDAIAKSNAELAAIAKNTHPVPPKHTPTHHPTPHGGAKKPPVRHPAPKKKRPHVSGGHA